MTKDIEENVFQSVLASKEPPLQPLASRKLGGKRKLKNLVIEWDKKTIRKG